MLLLASALCIGPAQAHKGEHEVAEMDFVPPPPGSYTLHRIMRAPAGEVLDTAAKPRQLAEFTEGKITLLALVYTRCSDLDGCMRAHQAMAQVRTRLMRDPALAKQVRFVSLSFDHAFDTPQQIATFSAGIVGKQPKVEWHWLTTAGDKTLRPIMEGLDQDLRVADDAPDQFTHMLKVYLLDRSGSVREIYTNAYLMPPMIVNDIKTLAMER